MQPFSYQFQSLDLGNRAAELDLLIQSNEQLLNKTREELEPRLENARNNLNTTEEFQQVSKEISFVVTYSIFLHRNRFVNTVQLSGGFFVSEEHYFALWLTTCS